MSKHVHTANHDRNIARAVANRVLNEQTTDVTVHGLHRLIRTHLLARAPSTTLLNLSPEWWTGIIVPVLTEAGWQRYPHAHERWHKSVTRIRLDRQASEMRSAHDRIRTEVTE